VHPRLGVVLAKQGGALGQMLPIFRFALGGPLGNGSHWMSWISIEDTVRALVYMIENDTIADPVNLVAPEPVRNKHFTQTLASALKRPAIFRVPKFAMRLAYGQLADEALFASQRVQPKALLDSGFSFTHPTLSAALHAELG